MQQQALLLFIYAFEHRNGSSSYGERLTLWVAEATALTGVSMLPDQRSEAV